LPAVAGRHDDVGRSRSSTESRPTKKVPNMRKTLLTTTIAAAEALGFAAAPAQAPTATQSHPSAPPARYQ
jgi:hypothetical protein